jgi:hypothetical protein
MPGATPRCLPPIFPAREVDVSLYRFFAGFAIPGGDGLASIRIVHPAVVADPFEVNPNAKTVQDLIDLDVSVEAAKVPCAARAGSVRACRPAWPSFVMATPA